MPTTRVGLLGAVERESPLSPPASWTDAGVTSRFVDENQAPYVELILAISEYHTLLNDVGPVTLGRVWSFF